MCVPNSKRELKNHLPVWPCDMKYSFENSEFSGFRNDRYCFCDDFVPKVLSGYNCSPNWYLHNSDSGWPGCYSCNDENENWKAATLECIWQHVAGCRAGAVGCDDEKSLKTKPIFPRWYMARAAMIWYPQRLDGFACDLTLQVYRGIFDENEISNPNARDGALLVRANGSELHKNRDIK